jgi:hypothetical protein
MTAPSRPGDGIGALVAAMTNKWDAATVDSFARSLENRDAEETDATTAAFQTLDTKASGLLTHVSMMIAGLGICAPLLAQHWLEEAVIVGEIIVYLLIAVGCLRCLSVVRTLADVSSDKPAKLRVQRELIIKHELYRLCNQATIYFTIIVFISFPIMLIWP